MREPPEYLDRLFARRVAANLRQTANEVRKKNMADPPPPHDVLRVGLSLLIADVIDAVTRAVEEETEKP